MQLKRFTDLGLRILMHLASAPDPARPLSISELAETLQWNQNLVVKVAHFMVQAGWVTSVRGRSGGLLLARDPKDYRLGDVVSALEGAEPLVDCETPPCPYAGRCGLVLALSAAAEAFRAKLNESTLEDIRAAAPGKSAGPALVATPRRGAPDDSSHSDEQV